MPARPNKCYRNVTKPAYTRKEYMRGIPGPKITIYDMGEKTGDFPLHVSLVAEEDCQIRHNALEAARVSANRYLSKNMGKASYHLRIRPHPHHVYRENKMMAFAGADRLQDGMRRSFGKPMGVTARVPRNQPLITVGTPADMINVVKEALRRAAMKFPTPCRIVIEKGTEPVSL